MKRRISGIIILFIISNISYGAFEDTGGTARSRGMADAVYADFDAVNSMNYNPATISMARSIQSYASWDTPYWGLNDQSMINTINLNVIIPFWNRFTIPIDPFFTKRGTLGISIHRLSVGGVDSDGSSVEFYHEGIYSFMYAKDLNDVLSRGAKISVGISASIYDIGVGNSVDVQNNQENFSSLGKLSFGLDAGLTYDFSEAIKLGLVYKNIVEPNISILPDGTDLLPSDITIGGNWNIGDLLYVLKKSKLGFAMTTYTRDPNDNRQADSSWNIGYEFKQLTAEQLIKGSSFKGEMLSVRLGTIFMPNKVGDQYNLYIVNLTGDLSVTGGLGFMYVINQAHQVNIDYSIEYDLNMGSLRHTVGVTYQFLFPNSAFAYREEARKELEFEELIKQRTQTKTDTNQPGLTNETKQSEAETKSSTKSTSTKQ